MPRSLLRPGPIADLRRIVAMLPRVGPGVDPGIHHLLAKRRCSRAETRHPVDDVHDEMEAIEIVPHDHVEWRRHGALFLVAPNVEVGMVRPAICQAVDEPGIPVVGEDDRPVWGEQRVELRVGQAVRMLRVRLEAHQIHDIHDSDREVREMPAEKVDRSEYYGVVYDVFEVL